MNDRRSRLGGAQWPKKLRIIAGECFSSLHCIGLHTKISFIFCLKESIVRDAKVKLFVVFFVYQSILIIKLSYWNWDLFSFVFWGKRSKIQTIIHFVFSVDLHTCLGQTINFENHGCSVLSFVFEAQLTKSIILSV